MGLSIREVREGDGARERGGLSVRCEGWAKRQMLEEG